MNTVHCGQGRKTKDEGRRCVRLSSFVFRLLHRPSFIVHRSRRPMLEHILDRLSESPQAWNMLRRVVEDGFRGEKEVIARDLMPWSDAGQREFLDFGCGTGEFAPCFPPAHYTGVDLAARYVRFAGHAH